MFGTVLDTALKSICFVFYSKVNVIQIVILISSLLNYLPRQSNFVTQLPNNKNVQVEFTKKKL